MTVACVLMTVGRFVMSDTPLCLKIWKLKTKCERAHNWQLTDSTMTTVYVLQLGNEMPPAVAKEKMDEAFKKPVEDLTLSEAQKIHADLFMINAAVHFGTLDVAALMELYHGTEITSGEQLHEKLVHIKDAIQIRFNL
jgi:hypothetical protein